MARIIIDKEPDEKLEVKASFLNKNIVEGPHFRYFIEHQKKVVNPDGTTSRKGLSPEGAEDLRVKTIDILAHCNPHEAVDKQETTHLVVGYVQSGKTMSFTALSALASDNGYRMIIYLAGTKKNLLDQTYNRLRNDLIGSNSENRDVYAIYKDPEKKDIEQIVGSLVSSKRPIILMPILKHVKHIDEVAKILGDGEVKGKLKGETIIIIDDEADQTSLNNYGRKNSKSDGEEEFSSTYDSILKLRAELPANSYVQYTATPQANLLISIQDLLAPKSHTLLNAGEGYVGGKLFFGKGLHNDLFNGALIKEIPASEVFHKKQNNLTSMPHSLEVALMLHILAVAFIVEWKHTEGINYLSMMVHPDETKKVNATFKKWIDYNLKQWRKSVFKEDGHDDKEDLLKKFEEQYNKEAVRFYEQGECPPFSEIRPLISEVLCSYKTYLVNTDKEADRIIDWNQYKMHILVGAEMLNRGFTVEKLTTTYMPRYSTGKANADTIEQRCRFFGYKMNYIKSCRVFLPALSIANYLEYIKHEEELRVLLRSSTSLEAAERRILLTDSLNPTRRNVIPATVVSTSLCGVKGMSAFQSKAVILGNDRVINNFLEKHKNDFCIDYKYNSADRTHRGLKLPVSEAIELLSEVRFGNETDAVRKSDTIRYLRYLSENGSISYVYFIQMAYGAVRERAFNMELKRLSENRGFFVGRSPSGTDVYPGDKEIHGSDETLTIQLYRFHLKGVEMEFPKDAYTFAIYYPKALATSYCGDASNIIEDD